MSSLLDQSALTDLAERLVTAARRAGADAADAIAVRSISLAVEILNLRIRSRQAPVKLHHRFETETAGRAKSSS